MAGGIDPNWLIGGGQEEPQAPPPQAGGGSIPFLKGIAFGGLDQPGRESVTFQYIDGMKLTESHGELLSLGANPQEVAMVVKLTAGWAEKARMRHHGRGGGP